MTTYLLLDTSTPECRLTLVIDGKYHEYTWQADRDLARGLLEYIVTQLAAHNMQLSDLAGMGVFRGPGSFTGLRIGMATLNTIADSEQIAIVGTMDDDWKASVIARLDAGEDDRIVLPEYGRAARITKPRK